MGLKFSIETEEFQKEVQRVKAEKITKAERLLERVAKEIVNYARSTGGHGTQPPARPGEGERQAHPGGWADITSNLAESIQDRVEVDGFRVTAIIEATMEYAEELDNKTGYDVLGGAETLARKAIRKHAPRLLLNDE